jgi:hypothetical protein
MKRIRKNWRNMAAINAVFAGATQGIPQDQPKPKALPHTQRPEKLTLADLKAALARRAVKEAE